jgi:hypothetical protein
MMSRPVSRLFHGPRKTEGRCGEGGGDYQVRFRGTDKKVLPKSYSELEIWRLPTIFSKMAITISRLTLFAPLLPERFGFAPHFIKQSGWTADIAERFKKVSRSVRSFG